MGFCLISCVLPSLRGGYALSNRSSSAERDTVSSRRCQPTEPDVEEPFPPWRGGTLAMVNPFRVDGALAALCPEVSPTAIHGVAPHGAIFAHARQNPDLTARSVVYRHY